MVPFAGYDMPVQYPTGIIAEHLWTREHAGLFDVSHMGQAALIGPDHETTARALEALVPADILDLKPGRQRYTQLLDEDGGILDDLMVARPGEPGCRTASCFSSSTPRCKEADYAHIVGAPARRRRAAPRSTTGRSSRCRGRRPTACWPGMRAGAAPRSPSCRRPQIDDRRHRRPMSRAPATPARTASRSRSRASDAAGSWRLLCADAEVKPIGLGARDSLRLEAGLCLYGHDIDTTTSPVEAGLTWSIQKRRREEGGFPGAERIQREIAEGPARMRVGLKPEGRAPAREGASSPTPDGREVGKVTSGGFGPTVNGPVAMGYVGARIRASPARELRLVVRGKPLPAKVVADALRAAPLQAMTGRIAMTTRYTKDHEYIRVEGDTGVVGITDYAQSQLGDVVFVELPEVGRSVAKGGEAAVVESVKAASEVYAPVSGEVVGRQFRARRRAGHRQRGPAGQGWFLKIELKDAAELEGLMSEEQYQDYVKSIS